MFDGFELHSRVQESRRQKEKRSWSELNFRLKNPPVLVIFMIHDLKIAFIFLSEKAQEGREYPYGFEWFCGIYGSF